MQDPMCAPDQQKYYSSKTVAVYVVETAGIGPECFTPLQVGLKRYCVGFCYI